MHTYEWDEKKNVMKLSKAGIKVPEHAIFYDDDAIVFDEDFEGDWERIEYDPIEAEKILTQVKIKDDKDISLWIKSRNIKLDELIENLLEGFYQAQKKISEKE